MEEYEKWCEYAIEDDMHKILVRMNESQIEDAFYQNLEFGTGGLRGTIGVGTNRMNVYTVAKASQGLANYLIKKYGTKASIVIGYDSRLKSKIFAETAASVFAANGIKVYIWSRLLPVSMVSYAVKYLKATAGVMITASHNPSKYNGYKVYNADGCQITTETASIVLEEIGCLDIFFDIKKVNFSEAVSNGKISYIQEEVFDNFIEQIKNQSVLYGEKIDKNVGIVYSPLNGTGLEPITRVLNEMGYKNVTIVEEQLFLIFL